MDIKSAKQRITQIYREAVVACGGYEDPLDYGPGHVIWSDDNFDMAELCLETFDELETEYQQEHLEIVKLSLQELTKIPLAIREEITQSGWSVGWPI